MNADPTFPHLDLDDLIAAANGQPVGGAAREHLADCQQCRLEANRWNLVADGVRSLAAAATETAPAAHPSLPQPSLSHSSYPAQPGRPQRTGLRMPAGRGRRVLLVACGAAAALVLFVGVRAATGLVHIHPSGSSTGTAQAVTAVTGCDQLEQAAGTLERVNGGLVIATPSGQQVTVTTTAATRLNASGALLGDIADGETVLVTGPSSNTVISADLVLLGGNPTLQALPGLVVVGGTVANASTAGFTIVTSAGTRVPVTTSGGTAVSIFNATLGELQIGGSTIAVGYAGPGGTLSAMGIFQSPTWPVGAHHTVTTRVKGCSPAAIDHEILALAAGG